MGPIEITCLVLILLVFLYLGFFFYAIYAAFKFSRSIKSYFKVLVFLCQTKLDIAKEINKELINIDISFNNTNVLQEFQDKIRENDIDGIYLKIGKEISNMMQNSNADYKNSELFHKHVICLESDDQQYQQIIEHYNCDLLAYNYWRNIIFIRPLMYLVGFREIKPIE